MAAFAELDAATLYALLRLRTDVFVVEQECAYPELDGRDTEPGTLHVWLPTRDSAAAQRGTEPQRGTEAQRSAEVQGYLRILTESDGGARIGRVCVAAKARGSGAAGRLMTEALRLVGDRPCVLDAQSHLVAFYTRYGFAPAGPEFVEDGIPHTPMARHQPPPAR